MVEKIIKYKLNMRKRKIKIGDFTFVDIRSCSQKAMESITSLDNKLRIKGYWWFNNLTRIPEGLRIDEDLDLYEFGFKELPSGIKVAGSLSLSDSTELAGLPDDLKVGKNLYLGGCKGLLSLPASLQVGRYIYYDTRTGFYDHIRESGAIPVGLRRKLKKY
jgi:hypothetical protein